MLNQIMLKRIKRTKLIQLIRTKLPEVWRVRLGDLVRLLNFVVYRRFYKKKLLALFPAFSFFFRDNLSGKKRILGIWNFATTPPTIGVFIEFQMRLLCMAHVHDADKIDFAFIYDPAKPVVSDKYKWVNFRNFHYHFIEMYPMLNINPRLGSVFIFDSHNEFESFLVQNSGRYITHPNFFAYVNGSDSRPNFNFIRDFYLKKGFLPKFEFRQATLNWGRAFVKKYLSGKFMVTVGIRFNFAYTPQRNSNLKAWQDLFEHCFQKYPDVVFVVLARRNEWREITERIKLPPNVIFSKDYNTNIEQDLVLIELSLFYMATIFGPASFPFLTQYIPFVMLQFTNPEPVFDFSWLKKGDSFPWQDGRLQRLVWEPEDNHVLIREFERLLKEVDKNRWTERLDLKTADERALEWPFDSRGQKTNEL